MELAPSASESPKDPVVQFYRGIVALLRRLPRRGGAGRSGRAKKVGRDTHYEMQADSILHPQYFTPATASSRLRARGTTGCSSRARCCSAQGHQHSARARLRAGGAGSGRTTTRRRSRPRSRASTRTTSSASFSRLGPLRASSRSSQSVRYHLGLLLAWTGQRDRGDRAVPAGASRSGRRPSSARQRAMSSSAGLVAGGTNAATKMSRSAYGVRPVRDATVPHPVRRLSRRPLRRWGAHDEEGAGNGGDRGGRAAASEAEPRGGRDRGGDGAARRSSRPRRPRTSTPPSRRSRKQRSRQRSRSPPTRSSSS